MSLFPSINTGGIKKAGAAANKGLSIASTVLRANTQAANAALQQGKTEGLGYLDTGQNQANKYYGMATNLYNQFLPQDQAAWNVLAGSYGLNGQAGHDAAVGAFQHSPGYQAALDEAQQGVLRHYADTGGTASGGVLRELQNVAQNAQNQDYGNWQTGLATYFNPHNDVAALTNIYGNQAATAANIAGNKAGTATGTGAGISSNFMNYGQNAANLQALMGQNNANTINNVNNAKYQNSASNWSNILGIGQGLLGLF